jgi:hypothetical protein
MRCFVLHSLSLQTSSLCFQFPPSIFSCVSLFYAHQYPHVISSLFMNVHFCQHLSSFSVSFCFLSLSPLVTSMFNCGAFMYPFGRDIDFVKHVFIVYVMPLALSGRLRFLLTDVGIHGTDACRSMGSRELFAAADSCRGGQGCQRLCAISLSM